MGCSRGCQVCSEATKGYHSPVCCGGSSGGCGHSGIYDSYNYYQGQKREYEEWRRLEEIRQERFREIREDPSLQWRYDPYADEVLIRPKKEKPKEKKPDPRLVKKEVRTEYETAETRGDNATKPVTKKT